MLYAEFKIIGDILMLTQEVLFFSLVALFFAQGWYLNEKLKDIHLKIDKIMDSFDGLREYLYEIDPQFDDERKSLRAFENEESIFAGMDDMQLIRKKENEGKRTLNTPFC